MQKLEQISTMKKVMVEIIRKETENPTTNKPMMHLIMQKAKQTREAHKRTNKRFILKPFKMELSLKRKG